MNKPWMALGSANLKTKIIVIILVLLNCSMIWAVDYTLEGGKCKLINATDIRLVPVSTPTPSSPYPTSSSSSYLNYSYLFIVGSFNIDTDVLYSYTSSGSSWSSISISVSYHKIGSSDPDISVGANQTSDSLKGNYQITVAITYAGGGGGCSDGHCGGGSGSRTYYYFYYIYSEIEPPHITSELSVDGATPIGDTKYINSNTLTIQYPEINDSGCVIADQFTYTNGILKIDIFDETSLGTALITTINNSPLTINGKLDSGEVPDVELADGLHTLYMTATDRDGNESEVSVFYKSGCRFLKEF